MTFKAGQSGNPSGRRRGTPNKRTQLAKLLEPHAEELITKLVELARAGDIQALRLCIERLIPKAEYAPIEIELPDVISVAQLPDVKRMILAAALEGKISVGDAEKLAILISHEAKTTPPSPPSMPIDPVEASKAYQRFMRDS